METVALVIAGAIAAECALWFGWWVYRQVTETEPEAGFLMRSLTTYFIVAGMLLFILLAIFWVLVLVNTL